MESVTTGLRELGSDVIRDGTLLSFYEIGAPFLVSEDRRTTILPFAMAGDFDDATDNIKKVIEVVDETEVGADLDILITGQATVGKDFEKGESGRPPHRRDIRRSDRARHPGAGLPVRWWWRWCH